MIYFRIHIFTKMYKGSLESKILLFICIIMNIYSIRIFNSGRVFITQQLNRDYSYFVLHKCAHPQNHSPPKLLGFPGANGVLVVASSPRKINDLFCLPISKL